MKYIVKYKEQDGIWRDTSYTSPFPVTEGYLISFFALDECLDFIIEENI